MTMEQFTLSDACTLGNLIFEKKYQEAIDLGTKLLETKPDDCGIHINLMVAYFKLREIQGYWAKSSYHAKQAIINGHTTGYAHERLAKNLDSAKLYHKSLQLYNLILDNKDFHFSASGCGRSIDWEKRRTNVLANMNKALDKDTDILFTQEEIAKIIQTIKDEDIQLRKEQLMRNAMERAWERGDDEEYHRLFKKLHPNHYFSEDYLARQAKMSEAKRIAKEQNISMLEALKIVKYFASNSE